MVEVLYKTLTSSCERVW